MKHRFLLTTHFNFIALRRFEIASSRKSLRSLQVCLPLANSTMVCDKFFQQLRHRFTVDKLTHVKVKSSVFSSPPVHCW
ncbi:hypothetical protein ACNKHS_18580 [Shigella flexneri]